MAFESTPFFGRDDLPSFRLGNLEAIEQPSHPEAHLQPFQPQRHGEALRQLTRHVLRTTGMDLARLTNDELAEGTSDEQGAEQLVADLNGADRLTLLLFEDRWKREGSLLGYVSLRQTEEDRAVGRAAFTALALPDTWEKYGLSAAESLFAFGLERRDIETVNQPKATYKSDILHRYYFTAGLPLLDSFPRYEYDVKSTRLARGSFLENTRQFYSSRFGEITSTFHWPSMYGELLSNDVAASQRQVAINGLHMTALTRRDLVPVCRDAVQRGVNVEINLDQAPVSEEVQAVADAFADAGAKLQVRGGLPRLSIIDQEIWYDSKRDVPELGRLGVIRRTEAERPLPAPVIQYGRLE